MSDVAKKLDELSPVKRALVELRAMQSKIDQLEQEKHEPLAVIGIGCRFPGGVKDPESFWKLLMNGTDAIKEVPSDRWDVKAFFDPDPLAPGKMITRWGGFIDGIDRFDPDFFGISQKEAVSMDPQQRLLLEVAWEALEHAGQAPDQLFGGPSGVFIGISSFDYLQLELKQIHVNDIDAYFSSGIAHSVASGRLSYALGLQGPSISVDTACSSSLVALHLACQSLRLKECGLALAGGVNLLMAPEFTINFSKAKMMAADGRCKTFDAAADGYVRGEGCGIVVLRRLTDAVASGDRILAVIRGSAVNQDGRSSGLTAPNGPSQQAVIRSALSNAGLEPSQIRYVEAHGTGTSLGDPIEVQALAEVFGHGHSREAPLLVGSVKTNVGHLEAAAGIAGFIKLVLAIQHGIIPPHIHLRQLNPHVSWVDIPVEVTRRETPWPAPGQPRIGGVSSFGFSGTNAHILVGEVPAAETQGGGPDRPLHIFPVSARTEPALRELLSQHADYLTRTEGLAIRDICHTAGAGRTHFENRAAFVAGSVADLVEQLRTASTAIGRSVVGPGKAHPEMVFMFTGQGANYGGMGRELWDSEPVFRQAFEGCARLLSPFLQESLQAALYPDSGAARSVDDVGSTQAAIFALEYALAELWRSWGIQPTAVIGHGVGEYAAGCVAGVFSLEDAARLIGESARLIESLPGEGMMAAVFAEEARVRSFLEPYAGKVEISGLNGPQNIVVSGDGTALKELLRILEGQSVRAVPLQVAHAFHSPLMDPILDRFEAVVRGIRLHPPRLPMVSSLTGKLLPRDRAPEPVYWRRHLRQPVRFSSGMRVLYEQGHRVFIEMGPRPVLCGLGREILTDEQVVWLPSLRQGAGDCRTILGSLSQLYAGGMAIDWRRVDRARRPSIVSLPTYPFQRNRCWPTAATSPAQADMESQPLERALAAGRRQAQQVPIDLNLRAYPEKWECLDHLTTAYIIQALRGLSVFTSAAQAHTVEDLLTDLGILSTYRGLLGRWLDRLVGKGLLERRGGSYFATQPLPPPDVSTHRDIAAQVLADIPFFLSYMERCGEMLIAVLTGKESPLETLFPGGSPDTAEHIYQDWALSRYFNETVAAVTAATVAGIPRDPGGEPIRIIEIGAGTGSTTRSVLPLLPHTQIQYVFTDISEVFFHQAERKFNDYPFLRYASLNIEQAPEAQGFGVGQFDIAIAANVLHATGDLRGTLQNVRSLLSPGGLLVLYEVTSPHSWFDITVALVEGWQRFSDDLRTDGPLLSADQWSDLLRSQGFQDVMAFPEPGSPAEILRAHVIVARTPSDLQRTQQGLPGLSAAGHRFALALHRPEADALSGGEAHEPLRARLGYLTPEERREHLVDFVRSHVNGVLHRDPSKPISRDRRLMDLGVDSLMAVELRDRLGRGLELDRSLPATLIFDHPTIDAIADYIEREVLGVHCHAEPRGEKDNAVCEDSPLGAEVLGNLADDEVEKLILKKLEAMDKEE